VLDFIELAEDYSVAEVAASPSMLGKTIRQLDVRAKYGVNIIAIKSNDRFTIAPRPDQMIERNDILVVIGHNLDLKEYEEQE
jgi:trk system potassium uptake protein TrkA